MSDGEREQYGERVRDRGRRGDRAWRARGVAIAPGSVILARVLRA